MYSNKWHVREIKKFVLENKYNLIFPIIVSLFLVVWYVYTDNKFVWKKHEPIPDPVFTLRMLGGIVFGTLGAFLYKTRAYLFLYKILPYKTFVDLKRVIWHVMMFTIGFFIVPGTIDLANVILSFLLNVLTFIVWVFPLIGAPVLLFLLAYWIKKLWTN